VVVRNYEGLISTYVQPLDYHPHDPATCAFCQARRDEGGQEGIGGLLTGERTSIMPEGWHTLHQRRQAEREKAPAELFGMAPMLEDSQEPLCPVMIGLPRRR
jgi:lysine 2,3-aminomutase